VGYGRIADGIQPARGGAAAEGVGNHGRSRVFRPPAAAVAAAAAAAAP
jgi:hypothetical protein